jgi:hypothetical protein
MEESKMKELDCVEVTVEKEKYARDGVHKGMNGWICDPRCIDGYWLVSFPQYGEKENIATLEIKEDDLKLIPVMDATMNEQIKAQFENVQKTGNNSNGIYKENEDISDYMI